MPARIGLPALGMRADLAGQRQQAPGEVEIDRTGRHRARQRHPLRLFPAPRVAPLPALDVPAVRAAPERHREARRGIGPEIARSGVAVTAAGGGKAAAVAAGGVVRAADEGAVAAEPELQPPVRAGRAAPVPAGTGAEQEPVEALLDRRQHRRPLQRAGRSRAPRESRPRTPPASPARRARRRRCGRGLPPSPP